MDEDVEYRCFIGGLCWSIFDSTLRNAFEKFGNLIEARVVREKLSGRSKGFGFVTFDDRKAMEEAIEEMNGKSLNGMTIKVEKAHPYQGSGGDRDRERNRDRDRERNRDRGRDRDYGGRDSYYGDGRGSSSRECNICGKHGHFARECSSGDGARGGRYGGQDSKYGGGGGGSSRYGPDRNRYGGHNRDGSNRGSSGSDRYNRDRTGPYERPGGFRS